MIKQTWRADFSSSSTGERSVDTVNNGFSIQGRLDRDTSRIVELRIMTPIAARNLAQALLRYADEHDDGRGLRA